MATLNELEEKLKKVEACFDKNAAKTLLKPYYTIVNEYKTKKRTDPKVIDRAYVMLDGLLECKNEKKAKKVLIIAENPNLRASLAQVLKCICNFETESCSFAEADKYAKQDYQLIEINSLGKQKFGNSIFYNDPFIDLKDLISKLSDKKEEKGLEYRIGNLLGVPTKESKFIICKKDNFLEFYSANLKEKGGEEPYHMEIAEYNRIGKKNVLGGGRYHLVNKTLKIYSHSADFGAIPLEALEKLSIVLTNYIDCDKYKVNKKKIEKSYFPVNKKWKNLGFNVK